MIRTVNSRLFDTGCVFKARMPLCICDYTRFPRHFLHSHSNPSAPFYVNCMQLYCNPFKNRSHDMFYLLGWLTRPVFKA